MVTPTIQVARMEARARALSLLASRLATVTLDSPARPYVNEADPNATKRSVDNWRKAEALLALATILSSGEEDAHHLKENLGYCLDLGAIEAHSPLHSAIADLGATL